MAKATLCLVAPSSRKNSNFNTQKSLKKKKGDGCKLDAHAHIYQLCWSVITLHRRAERQTTNGKSTFNYRVGDTFSSLRMLSENATMWMHLITPGVSFGQICNI